MKNRIICIVKNRIIMHCEEQDNNAFHVKNRIIIHCSETGADASGILGNFPFLLSRDRWRGRRERDVIPGTVDPALLPLERSACLLVVSPLCST